MKKAFRDFTITVNDTEYRVVQDKVCGFATKHPVVYIDPKYRNKEELNLWLHEFAHIAFPKWTEREVEEFAHFFSMVLWRAGYRRTPRGKND